MAKEPNKSLLTRVKGVLGAPVKALQSHIDWLESLKPEQQEYEERRRREKDAAERRKLTGK